MNQAFLEHCVLVFRDQPMGPKQTLDLSNTFGPVEPHITVKYRHPDYPDLIVMTNMGENGEISERVTARGVGWHTDMYYMSLPAKATLLHTIENSRCGRLHALCKHVHGAVRNAASPARSDRGTERDLPLRRPCG